jgi:amino acid adenylation domain-containing protein/FkbM family methyltransferase
MFRDQWEYGLPENNQHVSFMSEQRIEGYRVSVQQERLWALYSVYGESAFRSSCAAWLPIGEPSAVLLRRTLISSLRRHESLRTSFRLLPAMSSPVQCVLDPSLLDDSLAGRLFEFTTSEELSVAGAADRDVEDVASRLLSAWESRERTREFDLAQAPLVRAVVVECGNGRPLLCLLAPGLVVDREGLEETMQLWLQAYANEIDIDENEKDQEPLQYADYAEWQHELLGSEETREAREFWQRVLESVDEPPKLGFLTSSHDSATSIAKSAWQPAQISRVIPPDVSTEIERAARLCNAEPRDVLEAAWRLLLWRLSDRPADLTLQVFFGGRAVEELRGAVGAYARFLPMSREMAAEHRMEELVSAVCRGRQEAARRQEFFRSDAVNVGPDRSDTSNYGFEFAGGAGGDETHFAVTSRARCEAHLLLLRARLRANGFEYELEYDASMVRECDARRLAGEFEAVLRNACARPPARLWELSAASSNEQSETARINQTAQDFGRSPALLHELVETQARRTPDSTALECGEVALSYAELERRAERVAHFLRSRGVSAESRVALLMERWVEAVVSLLGVLKSGAAYVPLDSEYPHERLRFMLNDSGARVVLTQRRVLDEAGWLAECDVEVVAVDELLVELEKPDATGPSLHDAVSPQNLAYVIYTSGSTGTPKGVMVSHEAIRNRLLWMQQRFPLNHDDKVLLKTSLSFDASIWELFSPLLAGARVVLAEPGGQRDPDYLVREVQRRGITVLQMVPSMWRELAAEGVGLEACRSLRRVYSGGEALGRELAERLQGALPAAELVNLYGPTEAAIDASYWLCGGGEMSDGDYSGGDYVGAQVVIGQPVANMALYVLDEGLKFCAAGEAGELYLSGVGLARGYLKRAALTADKFVPDPHAERPGARMYRTGDVARRLSDGRVAYVGRADGQVKVRGYRVELGEVEAALRALAGVREAVAVGIGTERLVAYVVADRNGTNGTHKLTAEPDSLLETLPNGIRIYQLNRNETEVLYQEIFEQQSYLRHGVTVQDGDCVFDVGANIGMFTVFVNSRCAPSRVYAFEPIPETHEVLRRNLELHGIKGQSFVCGLSSYNGTAQFTYYPRTSTMSGAYADAATDERVSRAFLRQQHEGMVAFEDELMEGRFVARNVNVSVRTLSDVIKSEGVERIDLLKIDVEKSELDVLKGIEDADWERIVQLVVEVHDESDRIAEIKRLLASKGFEVEVEEDLMLKNTGLYNIYAVHSRRAADRAARRVNGRGTNGHGPALKLAIVDVDELRTRLAKQLPDYMVPSQIILLDELPVLANGKVNRKALPAPETMRQTNSESYVAPQTPVEELLAGIWADALRVEQVGVDDNFFKLGGHSLLATQIISRINEVFRAKVPLRSLFDAPSVRGLSGIVEEIARSNAGLASEPIERISRDGDLPLSFAQQRLWFLYRLNPDSPAYNITTAVRFKGELNVPALQQSLDFLIERHETLRTTFAVSNGRPRQSIAPVLKLILPIVDLRELPEGDREAMMRSLVREESLKPFDLSTGPLLRASLLQLDDHEHVAMLTLHHIISDGWSVGVFVQELSSAYEAFAAGSTPQLPELPIQYADFAAWQRQWLQGEVLEAQVAYWRQQLSGAPPVQELPTDKPRPKAQSFVGATHILHVPMNVTEGVKRIARGESASLFMTLLTAVKILMRYHTGEQNIVIGTDVANRNRADIEGLIGFFINQLVLHTNISGNPTFRELLVKVREVTLGAYAHQDVPFDKLVELLNPDRDLSRTPLFQTKVVLQNTPTQVLTLPGLQLTPVDVRDTTAKFDLAAFFEESHRGISCELQYNTDLYEAATIEQFAEQLALVLERVAEHPDITLNELDQLIGEAERGQRKTEKKKLEASNLHRFQNIKPKAVSIS